MLVACAQSLVLIGIAAWAYDRGTEDWRWQLSGVMEDPLFLRGVPRTTSSPRTSRSGPSRAPRAAT